MSEVRRLAELLHQAYEGEAGTDDAWHGPSLRKLVTGLTAADAGSAHRRLGRALIATSSVSICLLSPPSK